MSSPRPPLRFPAAYTWLVFLASMDIMLTWIVLYRGGNEVNALAAWIIARFGLPGMVLFKFMITLFVISLCEIIARRKPNSARKLSEWAVALTSIPVIVTLFLLLAQRLRA